MRKNVREVLFERIIDGLTRTSGAGGEITATPSRKPDEIVFRGNDDAVQEFFGEQPDLHGVLFEHKAELLLLLSAGATLAGELTGGAAFSIGDFIVLALIPIALTVLATLVARAAVLRALRQDI